MSEYSEEVINLAFEYHIMGGVNHMYKDITTGMQMAEYVPNAIWDGQCSCISKAVAEISRRKTLRDLVLDNRFSGREE